jgi:hypothetical protein
MTVANVNVTKVLLKRGNTAQNNAYTGVNGEITIDTQAATLRIHNGTTLGGTVINAAGIAGAYSNTNTAAYLESQSITSANIGSSQTFANANAAVQATAISSLNANIGAYQTYSNANAATQTTAIDTINFNIGSYQTWANNRIQTLDANLGSAATNIAGLLSNAAIQQSLLDTLTGNAATQSTVLDTLTANAATQSNTLTTLLSNAIAQQTSLVDLVANAVVQAQAIANVTGTYSNTNVSAYLTSVAGNILPAANVTYSLGDATHQWKDLWVSNNTIYIGNTPIRVDGSTLLVNGAPVNSNTARSITQVIDSNATVNTSESITTNNSYDSPDDFVADIIPTGFDYVFPGLSQRNDTEIEVNLFVESFEALYTYLLALTVGRTAIATYSTVSGNQTYTSTVSQTFSAIGQFDPGTGWGRVSGRILGTVPVGYTGLVGINFPVYSTQSHTWQFGTDGNLILPDNTFAVKYANGNLVSLGGGAYGNANVATYLTRGNVTLGNVTIQDEYDQQWRFSNGALIWPAGDGTPTGPYIDGSTLMTVYPENDGEFRIQTYSTTADESRQWKFTSDANLIVPDDATIWSDVDLRLYAEAGNIALGNQNGTWMFGNDGRFTAPGDVYGQYFTVRGGGFSGDEIGSLGYGGNIIELYGTNGVRISTVGEGGPLWQFNTEGNLTLPGNLILPSLGKIDHATGTSQLLLSENGFRFESNVGTASTYIEGLQDALFLLGGPNGTVVGAGPSTWSFSSEGNLSLPTAGNIVNGGNVWTFSSGGNLTLPGTDNPSSRAGTILNVKGIVGTTASSGANISGFSFISAATIRAGSYQYSNGVSILDDISSNTAGYAIGYRDIPQVAFTGNATLAASDAGKHYYSTLSTANVLTIPNNASVSWNTGTAITVVNRGTGNISVAPGSDVSLYLAGNSTSAARTLTTYGMATLLNVAANVWMINGTGVV